MEIICFKHVPFEGPAAIADWARACGHNLKCLEVYAGETLPTTDCFDMLLVMGGPMNIYEEAAYPWLIDEKKAIRAAIDAGKPVVGICLGAQLIADVLGGPVRRGEEVEIGWLNIRRSAECPEELALPDWLRVYHWHGDTFTLPPRATLLASSEGCVNQGFLFDRRVLGLQCHLETTRESMNALIEACKDEIGEGPLIQSAESMQAEPESTFTAMQAILFKLLDHVTADV